MLPAAGLDGAGPRLLDAVQPQPLPVAAACQCEAYENLVLIHTLRREQPNTSDGEGSGMSKEGVVRGERRARPWGGVMTQ